MSNLNKLSDPPQWTTSPYHLTRREEFAMRCPPISKDDIQKEEQRDRARNPHNDSYKPKLRIRLEIEAALRFAWADAMLAESKKGGQS